MAQKSGVFITAAEARQAPVRDKIVHEEARSIESFILDASSLGLFEVTVDGGTPMTNSSMPTSDVWTVNPSDDTLFVPNHGFKTGDVVTVSSTVSLPSPLKSNSYYYVIYVDNDHIKISSSYANSVSGRPIGIDITAGVTSILVNDQGSGYIQPPAVLISGGGATESATARSLLANWGGVISISNTTSGAGYVDQPQVQIESQGSGATAGQVFYLVVGITVDNGGLDYRVGDVITVIGGTGTSSTAVVTEVNANGSIVSLSLSNPGNYQVLPSLSGASTTVLPGGGIGATVNLTMGIKDIEIVDGGSGYTASPRIIITDLSGVGALVTANLIGGSISSVQVINPGYGYVGNPSVVFDNGSNASAVASLIPTSVNRIVVVNNDYYSTAPSVTISSRGSGATAGTVAMKVVRASLAGTGTGYSTGDTLLVAGGVASENSWIRVTSVDQAGRIQSFSLENGGSYTSLPGLQSNPVVGGTGTLASFNLTFGIDSIAVNATGSGYVVPPIITIGAPSTGGVSATAYAVIESGSVSDVLIVSPGSGYESVPSVTISNGSGASAEAVISPTFVSSISMTQTGSGYTFAEVSITGGGASIDATAIANIVGDAVDSITIVDPGEGYTSVPTVIITGDGSDASATAQLEPSTIAAINIVTPGEGYNTPPLVSISGGAASAIALLNATGVDRIVVTDQGDNYTSTPTVYLIPSVYQETTPQSPVLSAQRGFSVSGISLVSTGVGYQTQPTVTISPPQQDNGEQATATAYIGAGSGTFAIRSYPQSLDYFKAWKGQPLSNDALSRPYIDRMDTIISYFTNMGYTINRLTNPSTNSTMMWKIQW
jgi:hypothetical protein